MFGRETARKQREEVAAAQRRGDVALQQLAIAREEIAALRASIEHITDMRDAYKELLENERGRSGRLELELLELTERLARVAAPQLKDFGAEGDVDDGGTTTRDNDRSFVQASRQAKPPAQPGPRG